MVKIVQNLVSPSKYYLKCPNVVTMKGITVHNTANDASAMSEINYMKSNPYEISFHFAVDDKEAVQGLPLNRNGWHASDGTGPGNMSTIAIEICYSKSGGYRFDVAEENAAELIAYLLKEYGWGIDRVKRHYDYAPNKKYCPHRTMDKGWDRFLNMVRSKMGEKPSEVVNIYYRMKTREDGWLPEVKNLEDYAGYRNHEAIGIAMRTDNGSLRYRITTLSGKTLGWITQCNIMDYINGWAGNGETIATIEAEYFTPQSIVSTSGYKYLKYKVNDYPYQIDLIKDKSKGLDGYAGSKKVACTKFQAFVE